MNRPPWLQFLATSPLGPSQKICAPISVPANHRELLSFFIQSTRSIPVRGSHNPLNELSHPLELSISQRAGGFLLFYSVPPAPKFNIREGSIRSQICHWLFLISFVCSQSRTSTCNHHCRGCRSLKEEFALLYRCSDGGSSQEWFDASYLAAV